MLADVEGKVDIDKDLLLRIELTAIANVQEIGSYQASRHAMLAPGQVPNRTGSIAVPGR